MDSEVAMEKETDSGLPLPVLLNDIARLYKLGCSALQSCSYNEAVDCLSKALEMQVEHFGELAIECAETYYKLGCAYLFKAQIESDPLVDTKDNKVKREESSCPEETKPTEDDCEDDDDEKAQVEGDAAPSCAGENNENGEVGDEEEEEEEEEEDDLESAWKMLDIARVIYDKEPARTLMEVDVLIALADVSFERELFQVCFDDYERALQILEGLTEVDSRRIAELCFKISLAKQFDHRPKEALEYCSRAATVCEQRVERLNKELASLEVPVSEPNGVEKITSEVYIINGVKQVGNAAQNKESISSVETELVEEIKELEGLLIDLREKVEELKVMAEGPSFLDTWRSEQPEAANLVTEVFSRSAGLKLSVNEGSASSLPSVTSVSLGAPTTSLATSVSSGLSAFSPVISGSSGVPTVFPVTSASSELPTFSSVNSSASGLPTFSSVTTVSSVSSRVSVVGRGVKRATPTPVAEEQSLPPDVQAVKKLTEGVVTVDNSEAPR